MERLTKMPESKISNKDIILFKNNNNYNYKENDGSITKVILSQNRLLSNFSDETFSEYTLRWIDENHFEILYFKSNNEARSNMNILGDKYYYRIIDFNILEQKFILVEHVPNISKFAKFNLNLDKKN